jgi:catechol 2,3-dioxygenase
MTPPRQTIRALGEIALRVRDLDAMERFYRDVVGLTPMRRFEGSAFFRIAEGFGGHTQILALFDRSRRDPHPPEGARSTVDHLAFTIALEDYEAEKQRLEGLGVEVSTTAHAWVRWRSIYFEDPEGNTVELVCYDPSVG